MRTLDIATLILAAVAAFGLCRHHNEETWLE